MFEIDLEKLLLVIVVAIVVIGPKDLPMALRTAGRWMGKIRRVSNHFRSGLETMIREAEMEELERKWREQNAAIMTAHPTPAESAVAEGAVVDQVPAIPAPVHEPVAIDPVIAAHAPTGPVPVPSPKEADPAA